MTIRQSVTLNGGAETIYEVLTSASKFSEMSGAPAEISANEGGEFSCFGGQITGRFIELVANNRIVQAWRAGPWDEGVYSIVRFDISESGAMSTINMEHSGFPDGSTEHLEGGWHKMYWEPLKTFLQT